MKTKTTTYTINLQLALLVNMQGIVEAIRERQGGMPPNFLRDLAELLRCETEEHLINVIGSAGVTLVASLLSFEDQYLKGAQLQKQKELQQRLRGILLAARPDVVVDSDGRLKVVPLPGATYFY